MENELIPLDPEERFRFSCSPEVPCFNACCRDLNQFLTPYDIVRLRAGLGLDSGAFLAEYASEHVGPESGLPIVRFRTDPGPAPACPLVTPEGCRAYPDRPSSCRAYPLARALTRDRRTGKQTEHFALLRENHCRGFEGADTWTARDWVQNQQLEPYFRMNDRLMQIIALKNMTMHGPLGLRDRQIFRRALYDIDAFRCDLFEKGDWRRLDADPKTLEAARTDDTALLELGLHWVARTIFNRDLPAA